MFSNCEQVTEVERCDTVYRFEGEKKNLQLNSLDASDDEVIQWHGAQQTSLAAVLKLDVNC